MRFEKINLDEFTQDSKEHTNVSPEVMKKMYENIKIPKRSTKGSAGYDFTSLLSFALQPGESILLPTGIRAVIDDGWWLMCVPRSSYGFKYRLRLDNTVGVIDSDYTKQIFAKITNEGNTGVVIREGDRYFQGVLVPYGIVDNDNASDERTGGIGSTDKEGCDID